MTVGGDVGTPHSTYHVNLNYEHLARIVSVARLRSVSNAHRHLQLEQSLPAKSAPERLASTAYDSGPLIATATKLLFSMLPLPVLPARHLHMLSSPRASPSRTGLALPVLVWVVVASRTSNQKPLKREAHHRASLRCPENTSVSFPEEEGLAQHSARNPSACRQIPADRQDCMQRRQLLHNSTPTCPSMHAACMASGNLSTPLAQLEADQQQHAYTPAMLRSC